jgi:hypothetical protein
MDYSFRGVVVRCSRISYFKYNSILVMACFMETGATWEHFEHRFFLNRAEKCCGFWIVWCWKHLNCWGILWIWNETYYVGKARCITRTSFCYRMFIEWSEHVTRTSWLVSLIFHAHRFLWNLAWGGYVESSLTNVFVLIQYDLISQWTFFRKSFRSPRISSERIFASTLWTF